ncbi:SDR family NAD(P)-dependent oxidoreductase [Acutalibacter sp.]|jgi:3-oxoacyl-[acyl-carrier protein] reductase|uniref:SDR family NAD(P)-dependent oxidoreductase n=1 Tax=Acutalibacter sp. TaxID=1918636 RepID=UPI00216C893B|nr:SDR family oxidoreductase [Acutalibacter sp.]
MLKGKNAVITGARRGIGRATAECFAKYGANIWACARKPDEAFEQDMAELAREYGVWIKPVYFDLTDSAELTAAVKRILAEKLPVDVLVNNAGITFDRTLFMTPITKMKEIFEIDFFAQISLMQSLGKYMLRKRSGSIINVTSVTGLDYSPGRLAYGASKAAMIWATRSCAKELAPYGIRVNAIAPGLVDTEILLNHREESIKEILEQAPLKRKGEPAEIAEAIAFLASDRASYITGEILVADGGNL